VTEPRILLLGGSHAKPSHTGALLRATEDCLVERGASTCRWDIGSSPLPPVLREPVAPHEASRARALRAEAEAADGFVIATPLYHGSYSGCVKDALDHLSAKEVQGKVVALLSHAGGFPTTQALDHLGAVARSLRTLAVPGQVVTVNGDYRLCGDRYVLASEEVGARLGALADELLWLAVRLRPLAAVEPRDHSPLLSTLERRVDEQRALHDRSRVVQRS
jgi:NAD(P)H-dependent FMN reductase